MRPGSGAGRTLAGLVLVLALAGGALWWAAGSRSSGSAAPAAAVSPRSTSPAVREAVPVPVLPRGREGVPGGGLPDPAAVDGRDPEAVGRAALGAMYAWDTGLDVTLADAERRAVPWLTAGYGAAVASRSAVAAGGAAWSSWAGHRAYGRVSLELLRDERPSDSSGTVYRQWSVTVVPTGRDGWTGAPVTAVAYVEVVRVGEVWRVAGVRVS
ncbi:hypothetical protein [Embleya sp. NPDC005971]|uniref:hypothetical protein n=1 Tax=Embleya sp. NPDC005971 TaxID=3156724 RepID=UPI0033C94AF5